MEYLTRTELRRLFAVAYERNRTHHLAMVVGLWHGLRVSEIIDSAIGRFDRNAGFHAGGAFSHLCHSSRLSVTESNLITIRKEDLTPVVPRSDIASSGIRQEETH